MSFFVAFCYYFLTLPFQATIDILHFEYTSPMLLSSTSYEVSEMETMFFNCQNALGGRYYLQFADEETEAQMVSEPRPV